MVKVEGTLEKKNANNNANKVNKNYGFNERRKSKNH